MSNSSLVTKSIPANTGNYTKNRSKYGKISEITIHHAVGNMTIDSLGKLFQTASRKASSHYGVQHSQIGLFVDEANVAWTNSSWAANCRAVTIETSNSGGAPDWPIADDTLGTLIKLVADIAKRNGLHPLVYGKSLTWHSMYAATVCPGPYLAGKLRHIVDKANEINSATSAPAPAVTGTLYRVQVGAFSSASNAMTFAGKVKKAGFEAIIRQSGKLYHVQVGAFAGKKNAEDYMAKVKKSGFDAIIVQS